MKIIKSIFYALFVSLALPGLSFFFFRSNFVGTTHRHADDLHSLSATHPFCCVFVVSDHSSLVKLRRPHLAPLPVAIARSVVRSSPFLSIIFLIFFPDLRLAPPRSEIRSSLGVLLFRLVLVGNSIDVVTARSRPAPRCRLHTIASGTAFPLFVVEVFGFLWNLTRDASLVVGFGFCL
ncbi:hypothetical protein GLYMA_20G228401v4 [Glycine max]|nr:hypothetical protein GLYMA_20G228401v4 [Glycine max]